MGAAGLGASAPKRVALRQISTGAKTGRTFTQTTLMCLSASIAFLVCVTPSIVLTVGRFRWQEEPHKQVREDACLLSTCFIFYCYTVYTSLTSYCLISLMTVSFAAEHAKSLILNVTLKRRSVQFLKLSGLICTMNPLTLTTRSVLISFSGLGEKCDNVFVDTCS